MKAQAPKALVLCEGKDDMLVMQELARHAGIGEERLEFHDYGGESKLRQYLSTLKASPEYTKGGYSRILVTRDADKDFSSAWQSLADSIQAVFSQSPTQVGEWVISIDGVPIAAWVIPGPGQSGMIETLCLDAARTANPQMFACLDPFMECLKNLHGDIPHEKVRFVLWTIIAQGKTAKDRLSLDRAIKLVPIHWNDAAFSPLRDQLTALSK